MSTDGNQEQQINRQPAPGQRSADEARPGRGGIAPEMAKQMAEILYQREIELADILANAPIRLEPSDEKQQVLIEHNARENRIESHIEALAPTIGDGSVTFYVSLKGNNQDFPGIGIQTPYRLDVGIHSDEMTREAMEQKGRDPSNRFSPATTFLVGKNKNGEYALGKVSRLPLDIRTSHPELRRTTLYKWVGSELQPGDVEMAGAVINMLTERLKPRQPQEQ